MAKRMHITSATEAKFMNYILYAVRVTLSLFDRNVLQQCWKWPKTKTQQQRDTTAQSYAI